MVCWLTLHSLLLFLLLNLLYRLTPVLPEFRVMELCLDFLSSVSSFCLDCAIPVDDYL
jgi:hypothetical protein